MDDIRKTIHELKKIAWTNVELIWNFFLNLPLLDHYVLGRVIYFRTLNRLLGKRVPEVPARERYGMSVMSDQIMNHYIR